MARLSTYTKDLNLTGKDMLAGSNYITTVNGIDQFETNNFTLEKITEYINGQIITDPSVLSLKVNGGLVYETVSSTNYLAVDLSATNITGQLANSDLANSTITINGTSVALGGSITIGEVSEVIAGTYLNGGGAEGTVTLNHDSTTRTDTTSSITPAHETSFTVIDTLSTNSTGHVTGANTKTVTLPSDTTYTIEAIDSSNDALIRLIGSDSTTDDIKLKAGSNIVINVNESTDEIEIAGTAFGNVYTVNSEAAMIAATSTAGDLVVRTDVSKTFIHNGGTTGTVADFTELQFSGIQQLDLVEGDGIDLEDHAGNPITVLTQNANDLKVINTLATASERGGIQIGYTENGKNYPVELSSEKAYVNVPWTDTTYTAGSGLDLVGTEFSHTDTSSVTNLTSTSRTYVDALTFDTYGHVTGYSTSTETVTDTNDYVDSITVTGSGTKTITIGRTGALADLTATFDDNDTTYTTATSSVLGLVKIGYTENGKNYPVELSSGQMFVNVPWTDNNTTYTAGIGLTLSGTTFNANVVNNATTQTPQAITTTANRLYQVETDDQDNLVVNVPWVDTDTDTTNWNFRADSNTAENISAGETLTFASGTNVSLGQSGNTITINSTDTNTTYSAGGGLDLNGTVFSHTDTSSQASVNNSGRTYIQDITLDTYGHVTGLTSATETVTDTNNYVTGASVTGTTTKTLTLTRQGLSDLTATWTDIDTNTDNYVTGASVSGTTTKTLTLTRSGGLGNLTASWTDIDTNTDTNYYLNTASFNTGNGVLSLGVTGYGTVTVDLDGRYLTSYSETDTLATVTARGNSTSTALSLSGDVTFTTNTKLNLGTGVRWQGYHDGSNGYLNNITGNYYIRNTAVNADLFLGINYNGSVTDLITLDGSTKLITLKDTTLIQSSSGNADLYLGNVISASSSIKGARFHSNDADFYFDFQGDATQNWFLRDYDGSGGIHTRFGFNFINATFTASGDIVAYGSPSDITLKENIKPVKDALNKVEKLQGVTFNWKEPGLANLNEDIGFIAQDVQKVLPELVRENENGKLSLRHQGIVPILLEAIKELSDKVKALENGITK